MKKVGEAFQLLSSLSVSILQMTKSNSVTLETVSTGRKYESRVAMEVDLDGSERRVTIAKAKVHISSEHQQHTKSTSVKIGCIVDLI